MTRKRQNTKEDIAALEGLAFAVRDLRIEKGLTQGQIAKRGGLDFTTIYMVERSEIELTWANMRRLAIGLNVSLDALFALAEELAPGEGGERWRRSTASVENEREIG